MDWEISGFCPSLPQDDNRKFVSVRSLHSLLEKLEFEGHLNATIIPKFPNLQIPKYTSNGCKFAIPRSNWDNLHIILNTTPWK